MRYFSKAWRKSHMRLLSQCVTCCRECLHLAPQSVPDRPPPDQRHVVLRQQERCRGVCGRNRDGPVTAQVSDYQAEKDNIEALVATFNRFHYGGGAALILTEGPRNGSHTIFDALLEASVP